MTTALQQNRYDRLLRRVGGMIGPGSKVNEALSELFPMIDVEGYQSELQLIKGTTLAMGGTSITSAVGENAKIQLFNPADSGQLVTVTRVLVSLNSLGAWGLTTARAALSDLITNAVVRDNRNTVGALPVAQVFRESSVGAVAFGMSLRGIADVLIDLRDENGLFVLSPDSGVTVGPGSTASTFHCNFMWRERVAETSELDL